MPDLELITSLPVLPPRAPDSHKGTFGNVLIVAGSRGMSGAAVLAGMSALRGGAGLVTVAVPESIQPIVAAHEPAYMTVPLPETRGGRLSLRAAPVLRKLAASATAVAAGPGWGVSSGTRALALELFRDTAVPLVLDADALNALADDFRQQPIPCAAPRILTPHPGEFARLLGTDTPTVQSHRDSLAAEFAERHRVVLLLKGFQTVITDGVRLALNSTGNPGLATGGAGDVLTGLIAAFLAQGLPAFEAAQLAAHVHGQAADLDAEDLSEPGLIASDLPRAIARALRP